MATRIDPATESFLNSMQRLQSRLQTVQRQITTGLSVERPSDSPEQVLDIVTRDSRIAALGQTERSFGRLRAEVDTAETNLQQAVRVIEEALLVASQAATTALSDANQLTVLASEVTGFQEEMLRLSLTQAEGRYVFGGDTDQQPPYELDGASPTGVNRLSTAAATRLAVDYDGSRFLVAHTAQEIFDSRDAADAPDQNNAFAALADLGAAISAGDPALASAAIDRLRSAHDHLNGQLAFYGGLQSRVEASVQKARSVEVQLTAELSEIRDTDITAAAVELARLETSLQAALQARTTFTAPSLFDFMR